MFRRRRVFPVPFAILALATLAACATFRQQGDSTPHPIAITVDNNLSLPSDLTVYLVSLNGGWQILGSARPAATTSFQVTPRSFSEPYRLLARTTEGRRLWSEEYTVGGSDTGEIVWTLVPNILAFRDVPDSTADTTKH